jgi:hypothetical protein
MLKRLREWRIKRKIRGKTPAEARQVLGRSLTAQEDYWRMGLGLVVTGASFPSASGTSLGEAMIDSGATFCDYVPGPDKTPAWRKGVNICPVFPPSDAVDHGERGLFDDDDKEWQELVRALRHAGVKQVLYWYSYECYEGAGCLLAIREDKKVAVYSLYHCSCYGPCEDKEIKFEDFKTPREEWNNSSVGQRREIRGLFWRARLNPPECNEEYK